MSYHSGVSGGFRGLRPAGLPAPGTPGLPFLPPPVDPGVYQRVEPCTPTPDANASNAQIRAWNAAHPGCPAVPENDPDRGGGPDPCPAPPASLDRASRAAVKAWNDALPAGCAPLAVPPFVPGGDPPASCSVVADGLTREQAAAWNAAHPDCRPLPVPPAADGGGGGSLFLPAVIGVLFVGWLLSK